MHIKILHSKVSEKMKHLYSADFFHEIDGKEEITEITSKIEKILKKIMKNSQYLVYLYLTIA